MTPGVERTPRYKRVRLRDPSAFEPGSFKTVEVGTHRVVVARPKGTKTTRAQSILHPRTEHNPCFFCGLTRVLT